MGSPWTDKSAILQDLSFAQGRWVPGGIESAVAGEKPPAHNIKEETEEEYFRRWTMLESGGAGDFSAGPDLFQIREMLELMQDEEAPNEEILSGPIEISKLNPTAPQFLPKVKTDTKENTDLCPRKPRKARNVAIASIMSLASELSQEPPKLIKPEDFIKPSKEDVEIKERRKDSVNKVTNWLQSQDITLMFKKKSVNSVIDKQNIKNVEPLSKSPASELSGKSPNGYIPTAWAEEYYRKAVDRNRMRDLVKEDVWGRAERAMKEIDTKKEELKKKEAEAEYEAELVRRCEALEAVMTAETAGEAAETTGEAAETAGEAAETAGEAAETAGEAAETFGEAAETAGEGAETVSEAAGPVENAESKGIAHILLPLSRHALYPGAACVVCRVLGGGGGGGEHSSEGV